MNLKHNGSVSDDSFKEFCEVYLVNKIYKILPMKEKGQDWESYLESFIRELIGASVLIENQHFFGLVSKLQGLDKEDHALFRKTIFECIEFTKKLPDKMSDL